MNILPKNLSITISEVDKNLENIIFIYNEDIIEGKDYTCKITYPLEVECSFIVKGSCNVTEMITRICSKYREIYEEEIELIKKGEKGKWGIWGHCLGDLILSDIRLEGDTILLGVDS